MTGSQKISLIKEEDNPEKQPKSEASKHSDEMNKLPTPGIKLIKPTFKKADEIRNELDRRRDQLLKDQEMMFTSDIYRTQLDDLKF